MKHARTILLPAIVMASLLILLSSCSTSEEPPSLTPDSPQLKAFGVVPEVMESSDNPITEEKITLGRMLYYEPRLSKGHDLSCNSCHMLDKYGVDNEPTSEGHKGQRGDRNSPTVYHAGGHFVQFWDGRAADVEEQAKGPVLNPVEMAMPSEDYVVKVLESMPEYVELFKAAFPEDKQPITYDNMAAAIGVFERKLVTPSRWDKFLAGDASALTPAELAGLQQFLDANCQTCHMGPYMGGVMFQKLGVVKPWPDATDTGRHKVTGNDADKMMFKVPSLRNIAKTGPYFHDGKVVELHDAIGNMGEYELGRQLTEEQIASDRDIPERTDGRDSHGVHSEAGIAGEHVQDPEAGDRLSANDSAREVFARPQSRCIVCGPDNPRGLQLRFVTEPDTSVRAEWCATWEFEGYNGVLHGGIISTLLDEAMAKAVIANQWQAMTVELKVRYRHHVSTGEILRIRGRIKERKKRRILTEAWVETTDGESRAVATGIFLSLD